MKKFEGYQRGINLGGWLSQCPSRTKEHFDTFITEEDIKVIASWGLDHVRVPVDYDVIEEENGTVKEEGMKHIEDVIAWCRKYNLKMVLDLHKTCGFMFDTKEVPNPDLFFTDKKLQDRFVETWERLIKRFGRHKDIVAFELLNEVVNPAYANEWNAIARRAMGMIRGYERDCYILVGGVKYNSVTCVPLLGEPMDDHIVYNFHCYEPLCFTHQHAYWVENIDFDCKYPATLKEYREKSSGFSAEHAAVVMESGVEVTGPEFFEEIFKIAIDFAEKYDIPLYCGEYGVIDLAPAKDSVNWLKDIHSVFEKYGIGSALWSYRDMDFGVNEAHYDEVRDEMLAILAK